MRLKPRLRTAGVGSQALNGGPECRRMVHMHKMRGFMRGEIIENEMRRHDQAPGKTERAGG